MQKRIKFGQALAFGTNSAVRENHTVVTARRINNTRFLTSLLICLGIANSPVLFGGDRNSAILTSHNIALGYCEAAAMMAATLHPTGANVK
jgi:hypothetical protein